MVLPAINRIFFKRSFLWAVHLSGNFEVLAIILGMFFLTLIIGGVAMVWAIVFPRLIELLEWTAAIYCVSLTAPLILGIYWSKATGKGAVATMVLTGIIASAWRVSGIESVTGVHFLIPALVFSFLTMFVLCSSRRV
ncbi:MAG: hypothetical protein AB1606_05505 [Nitrospirota bacterium]